MRQALAIAIDRESLVKNVTRGGQIPAYALTPPETAGYTPRAKIPNDLNLARKLLADAGYPDGKGLPPIEDSLYNTFESHHKRIAEAVQQMWKKNLGVDARLLNEEWKVYLDSMHSMNYQVARQGWIGDYNDPNTFLDNWVTGGGNNETGWSNAEIRPPYRTSGAPGIPNERLEVFQKAEAILMDEMPEIPIYFYTTHFLRRPEGQGWYPTLLDNHPFNEVYLEKRP